MKLRKLHVKLLYVFAILVVLSLLGYSFNFKYALITKDPADASSGFTSIQEIGGYYTDRMNFYDKYFEIKIYKTFLRKYSN